MHSTPAAMAAAGPEYGGSSRVRVTCAGTTSSPTTTVGISSSTSRIRPSNAAPPTRTDPLDVWSSRLARPPRSTMAARSRGSAMRPAEARHLHGYYTCAVDQIAYRTTPVSFTRRGSRLNDRQRAALSSLGSSFVLDVPRAGPSMSVDPGFSLDVDDAFSRRAPLIVEIGGGGGEARIDAAQQQPDTNFLALEVWEPGVAKTLMGIRRGGLNNIRIVMVNAAEALATMLPSESVDELWTFFPDPWPKKRHHKRRLVTGDLVPSVTRVL